VVPGNVIDSERQGKNLARTRWTRKVGSNKIVSANQNLCNVSATTLARLIRTKKASAEDVVTAHLEKITSVNPPLNAVVQLCLERALQEARGADAQLASGASTGPLHGVPFTIKDNFDTAGVISTAGTKGRAAFVPNEDATVVSRLRAAGGILLGKTNTPELTMAFETDNLVYGRTNNPHDSARTSGGSSGGAAAIVAAGGSPFDIGSDTGGSIRIPSHFCGSAGFKPTAGLVPKTGHILPFGGTVDAMTQIGPMARRVEDLALILPIIAGTDQRDPSAVPVALPPWEPTGLKTLRLAFMTDNGLVEPVAIVKEAVRSAANIFAKSGAQVKQIRPPGIEESFDLTIALWSADGGAVFIDTLQKFGTTEVHPFMRGVLDLCRTNEKSGQEFGRLLLRQAAFQKEMLAFMEGYDLLLSPVFPTPAIAHGATSDFEVFRGFSYTMAHNLTGWPAGVIRFASSPEGLPVGIQLAARPFHDQILLAAMQYLEGSLV
jgi:amidase